MCGGRTRGYRVGDSGELTVVRPLGPPVTDMTGSAAVISSRVADNQSRAKSSASSIVMGGGGVLWQFDRCSGLPDDWLAKTSKPEGESVRRGGNQM